MRKDVLEQELALFLKEVPPKYSKLFLTFMEGYQKAAPNLEDTIPTFLLFLELVKKEIKSPSIFEPYHKKIRHPIDYYRFGVDFFRPLVDMSHSHILGEEHLETIRHYLKKNENVILLANHQTESDPQLISLLLEKTHPEIGESIIYVAGERVVTDPLAIPFSLGCDLLCIYSKRYIDYPPSEKAEKQLHNKKTMGLMSRLLEEGGKIIYVAPSGGRDRRSVHGTIEVAPFDPDSIEMFYLMARLAKTPTHFIPFTLATYDLLPPPETIQIELGEKRIAKGLRRTSHLPRRSIWNTLLFPKKKIKQYVEKQGAKRSGTLFTTLTKRSRNYYEPYFVCYDTPCQYSNNYRSIHRN